MTATMSPNANGRSSTKDRRSLATEIDRFDKMIDGLDKAIPDAVADAIKEAIAPAVAEAFKATVLELMSNPQILTLLQGLKMNGVGQPNHPDPAEKKPSMLQRLRASLSSAWKRSAGAVSAATLLMTSPVKRRVLSAVGVCRQLNQVWGLRKPLSVALLVGVVIGAVGYSSVPWLAGVLAGSGAACSTLLAQFAAWSRRIIANVVV